MLSCVRTPATLSPPKLPSTISTCRRARAGLLVNRSNQRMSPAAVGSDQATWSSLGTPPCQLLLSNTLPTGQSFRWRLTAPPDTYTGVVGQRVVQLRQLRDDVHWRVLARGPGASPDTDVAALREYFNLDGADLASLYREWCSRDARFAAVSPHLPGARMLRQDPLECLFEFICSSNNHISRIHGMVERLCSTYGSELLPSSSTASSSSGSSCCDGLPLQQQPLKSQQDVQLPGEPATPQQQQQQLAGTQPPDVSSAAGMPPSPAELAAEVGAVALPFGAAAEAAAAAVAAGDRQSGLVTLSALSQLTSEPQQQQQQQQQQLAFYAFPTLQQLSAATEEALRADGFGYRAKFITGSVQQLLGKPGGGQAWLLSLRDKPYVEAHEALCGLPGVGPKVAACICLFSLDKHDAIPVDTHVWDLATRYYAPQLAKKTLNKQLHADIQQVFVQRFGPFAGWAHNTLFISELASHRHLLPAGLAAAADSGKGTGKASKKSSTKTPAKKRSADSAEYSSVSAVGQAGEVEAAAAAAAALAVAAGRRSSRLRKRTQRYVRGDSGAADPGVSIE